MDDLSFVRLRKLDDCKLEFQLLQISEFHRSNYGFVAIGPFADALGFDSTARQKELLPSPSVRIDNSFLVHFQVPKLFKPSQRGSIISGIKDLSGICVEACFSITNESESV